MSTTDFANSIQLFVKGVAGNTTVYHVRKDCTVDEFMKEVATKTGVTLEELRLIYGGKELGQNEGKSLADYRITNLSTLFVVLRLRGGWNPVQAAKLRKQELKPLPGYVTVTSTESCMISLDDDPSTKRAKMPCGHVIGPVSMSMYARSCLSQGMYTFPCPYVDSKTNQRCSSMWEYFMVRHVAALSPEEMSEYETLLAENYAQKALGVQQCPGCTTFCVRQSKSDTTVRCPICTKANKKPYEFCWSCLHVTTDNKCTNPQCDGSDPRIRFLNECPEIEMGYTKIKVPSLRACPHCGILINHIDGCKQMVCTGCKGKFCFVCLSGADKGGNYTCGSYNTKCNPAPRQTSFA